MNFFKNLTDKELENLEKQYKEDFNKKIGMMVVDDELVWLDEELNNIRREIESRKSKNKNGK